jgi:uncharacterized protein YbaP (TraB family)
MQRFESHLVTLPWVPGSNLDWHSLVVSANAAMPAEARAGLEAAANAVPFARGNLWHATKDGQSLTIVGTYHFEDPRHLAALTALAPRLDAARTLLVEAGPEEEARLVRALGEDPSHMFITAGPTLLERLPPDTWERLAAAFEARGVPGFFGAKFQPWYASIVLAIPLCALDEAAQPEGLDGLLIDAALGRGLAVEALEPWDTIFAIFGSFTPEQEIDMLESALAMEAQSADLSVTLADAYFRGESRLIWELTRLYAYDQPGTTRAEVDAGLALIEDVMMTRRNRAWIPVIEAAAARGPAVVAFGALHLSGETGVLNLLAAAGWTITPLRP